MNNELLWKETEEEIKQSIYDFIKPRLEKCNESDWWEQRVETSLTDFARKNGTKEHSLDLLDFTSLVRILNYQGNFLGMGKCDNYRYHCNLLVQMRNEIAHKGQTPLKEDLYISAFASAITILKFLSPGSSLIPKLIENRKELMSSQIDSGNIISRIEKNLEILDISSEHRKELEEKLSLLKKQKINILFCGGTGVGKSSTINALFEINTASVGYGPNPETQDIVHYDLDNLILWDTPGFGDGIEEDADHRKFLEEKLREKNPDGSYVIDLVILIMDGGTREYGTSFNLINKIIVPCLGRGEENRLIVAINQADMIMKGRDWDIEKSLPGKILEAKMEEKVKSVQDRIHDSTGLNVKTVCYCAGYSDGTFTAKPYNVGKLLTFMVENIKPEKRLLVVEPVSYKNINNNDGQLNYREKMDNEVQNGLIKGAFGGFIAAALSSLFGFF